jgi:hypothetical protein
MVNLPRGFLVIYFIRFLNAKSNFLLLFHSSHKLLELCSSILHLLREVLCYVDVAASKKLGLSEKLSIHAPAVKLSFIFEGI